MGNHTVSKLIGSPPGYVGYDQAYGARPLCRAIQKMVEDQLSEEMLKGDIKQGSDILIDAETDKLVFGNK